MTDETDNPSDLDALIRRLPGDIPPPESVWRAIEARLSQVEPSSRPGALDTLARALDRDVPPPPEVWDRIERRLTTPNATRAAPPRPTTQWRLCAGAAALVMIVAGLVLVARESTWVARPLDNNAGTPAPAGLDGHLADTSLGAWWMLRMPAVSPDVAEQMRRDLSMVEKQRVLIEAALEEHPADPNLQELWAHTYETEMKLVDVCGRTIMAYQRGDARE